MLCLKLGFKFFSPLLMDQLTTGFSYPFMLLFHVFRLSSLFDPCKSGELRFQTVVSGGVSPKPHLTSRIYSAPNLLTVNQNGPIFFFTPR